MLELQTWELLDSPMGPSSVYTGFHPAKDIWVRAGFITSYVQSRGKLPVSTIRERETLTLSALLVVGDPHALVWTASGMFSFDPARPLVAIM